ncbi:MAG: NAD(P)/FAD-dependent oxidoreductase [Blastocatellia bacterium]
METANIAIIGGGVVGTAIAAALARKHDDVFLLEAAPRLGHGQSTRNSGVIHAGIYYEQGSLKAFHCVRGLRMLYEFCAAHGVPHQRIGKLIVAETMDQLPLLEALKQKGDENGVEGLRIVERDFIRDYEPNLGSPLALYSPNTGIVEAEAYIGALARLARERGAHFLLGTPLLAAEVSDGVTVLRTPRESFAARVVINAAGLFSDQVARMFGYAEHTIYPCRGEYAELPPGLSNLIRHLVYPLPPATTHGLGVHFTKNMAGTLLLGPNARYLGSKEDYEGDRADLRTFYESAREMLPMLRPADLRMSYTGIRARLHDAHDPRFMDFVIRRDPQWRQVIHLIGIESPGLTSALSIAQSVAEMAGAVL